MFDDAEGENVVPNLATNAEESEAAARKYCEGFTARISVCEFPMCSLTFRNAARQAAPCAALLDQLHSSWNGGSLEQGGIDGLMAPAPPLDADDAAPLFDVDTLRDP
jgi:hypothetical protein